MICYNDVSRIKYYTCQHFKLIRSMEQVLRLENNDLVQSNMKKSHSAT